MSPAEKPSTSNWVERMGFLFMLAPIGLGCAAVTMGGGAGLLAVVFGHCFLYVGFLARAISSMIRFKTLSGVEFLYTLLLGCALGVLGPIVAAAPQY
ncbi:MAG: hypothetical protein ABL949_16035 [Fimbriimonadaceae bacterium]